jgi:hypothetical protein
LKKERKHMSKLRLNEPRLAVSVSEAHLFGCQIIQAAGCPSEAAHKIVDHLIDAELCGVDSHGFMRVLQYADEMKRGYLKATAAPEVTAEKPTIINVDGQGGIGILAMEIATQAGIDSAHRNGIAAIAVRNTGHTGRLGAFAEKRRMRDAFSSPVVGARVTAGVWLPLMAVVRRFCQQIHGALVSRGGIGVLWCWIVRQDKLREGGFMPRNTLVQPYLKAQL